MSFHSSNSSATALWYSWLNAILHTTGREREGWVRMHRRKRQTFLPSSKLSVEYADNSSPLHPKDPRIPISGSGNIMTPSWRGKRLYIHRKNWTVTIDVRKRMMISAETGSSANTREAASADHRTAFSWKTGALCVGQRGSDGGKKGWKQSLEEKPTPPLLSLETADKEGPSCWHSLSV